MNAKRTDPRVHCWQRPAIGGYVHSSGTTPEHLRAVFDAERERIAHAARPRRGRPPGKSRPLQQVAPQAVQGMLMLENGGRQ